MNIYNSDLLEPDANFRKIGVNIINQKFEHPLLKNLIEREDAFNKLISFTEQIQKRTCGLLRITGSNGCGRTSFISMSALIALRLNFQVVSICRNNRINILTNELPEHMDIFNAGNLAIQSLESVFMDKYFYDKYAGFLLIIDNIAHISDETILLLVKLLCRQNKFILGVIYSNTSGAISDLDFIDLPLNQTIYLEPLSPQGLCKWLKNELDFKPSRHFLEWLYNKTQGLPKLLHDCIAYLKKDEILICNSDGWSINKDYTNIAFGDEILHSRSIPKNNLPAELVEFFGREKDIRKVTHLLEKNRIVTLVGTGGIGKTRLSLKVASGCLYNYKDGVFFISLTGVTHEDFMISSIAKVLNIRESEKSDTLSSIKNVIKDKKMLLILDNFEQIIDKAPVISELTTISPALSILVTSREPLNIYGEHLYYLAPMEIPKLEKEATLEAIENQPTVALFLSRAKAVEPNFSLTKDNYMQIAELCACLEGIPLAIEIAASNITHISLAAMLSQRKQLLKWLKNGAQDLPDRQRTLKNTIEWGYNILNEKQKTAFRRIGVFNGAFDLKAYTQIANGKNDIVYVDEEDLLDLVNKSILFRITGASENNIYFNMLETIREYSLELLSESSEEKTLKDRHADYFISLAIEAESKIELEKQYWMEKFELIYVDLLQALEHLKKSGNFEKELQLVSAVGIYWLKKGYFHTGLLAFEDIISRWENSKYKNHFIKIYRWYSFIILLKSDNEKAMINYKKGLQLAIECGDLNSEADIMHMMSWTSRRLGNYVQAEELIRQSLEIYRRTGYKCGITDVLKELGQLYYFKGKYEQAEIYLKESIEICFELADKFRASGVFGMLGLVARAKGNYNEALDLIQRHLESSIEFDDKVEEADALLSIAQIERSLGNFENAEKYYLKAQKLGREIGLLSIIGQTLNDLGELNRYEGNYKKAYDLLEESLYIIKQINGKDQEVWIYRNMAEVELHLGNCLKAEELFIKGIQLYNEINNDTPIYAFLVIEGLAVVSLKLEQFDRSACLFGAAGKLYKVVKNVLAKPDIKAYEDQLTKLQQIMNDENLQDFWDEGAQMSIEYVLDYAIKVNDYRYDKSMAHKMINYIHENYYKDISLNEISEYFNMSASYLSTMFKYYTGQNFKNYLNSYRVKIAKNLLKGGNVKVHEVSKKVGCSNNVTFIRMFEKYESISPGKYVSDYLALK